MQDDAAVKEMFGHSDDLVVIHAALHNMFRCLRQNGCGGIDDKVARCRHRYILAAGCTHRAKSGSRQRK